MNSKRFEDIVTRSDAARGEILEIFYSDGRVVEGFVQHISRNYDPPYVNLCKSEVARGESSDHTVQFNKIIKIVVKPYNQNPITYE